MAMDYKARARQSLEEIWTKGNLDAVEEFVATNYVAHDPTQPEVRGRETFKQYVRSFRSAFPDLRFNVEDQVAEDDKVVTRWTAQGTHRGELQGIPPTGRSVAVSGLTVTRFKDDKAVEDWTEWDAMGLMRQLGVTPEPSQARAR